MTDMGMEMAQRAVLSNLVNTDLGALAEQGKEALEQYIGVRPLVCIAALALFLVLAVALIVLACLLAKQKKRRGKLPMTEELQAPMQVKSVAVGKLHEQGERSSQQDCFGVSDESFMESRGLLAVVADGMGGLSDGEKVSTAVVETVLDGFTLYQGSASPDQQLLYLARQAVERVNGMLGASGLKKSGSTLVMGLVKSGLFYFLSVGDSRVCLYRDKMLMQLNREHIFMHKLALDAANGEAALQEVYTDSRKSGLTSFLGMGALAHLDMPAEPLVLLPGDKLVLMSDGVFNALSREELEACLELEPDACIGRIKGAIQEKAFTNQDNYTAVVLACGA